MGRMSLSVKEKGVGLGLEEVGFCLGCGTLSLGENII